MVITEHEVKYGTFSFRRKQVGGFKHDAVTQTLEVFILSSRSWIDLGFSPTLWPFTTPTPLKVRDGQTVYLFLPEHIAAIQYEKTVKARVWCADQAFDIKIPLVDSLANRGHAQNEQTTEAEIWLKAYQAL